MDDQDDTLNEDLIHHDQEESTQAGDNKRKLGLVRKLSEIPDDMSFSQITWG